MTEFEVNKYSVRSSVVRASLSFVTNTKYQWSKYNTHAHKVTMLVVNKL